MLTTRSPRTVLVAALFAAALGCGAAGAPLASARAPAATRVRPDVHGEPLALLPPAPALWFRADAAEARRSPHWPTVIALLEGGVGDTLRSFERELGFDPVRASSTLALGLYLPPGARGTDGPAAWPVLYARGGFDREQVLAAARARAPVDHPLAERTLDGVTFHATATRAYLFPAPDVVMMFDPAMAPRVLRQLSGEERRSALRDARFDPLWTEVGGNAGTVRVAADLAALRSASPPRAAGEDPSSSLDLAVARAEAPGEARGRLAAIATSEESARELVASVDEVRASMLRRLEVRLLGLTRLLNQGITAVHEGRLVRVGVDATPNEASRVMASLRLVQAITR